MTAWPRVFNGALIELASVLRRNRHLAVAMTWREIRDRYAGQVLGSLWAIGHPVALMSLYVVIFAFIFKVRINASDGAPADYTIYILAGLIPWIAIQEVLVKSGTLLPANSNLVKQVVFPLEILPAKGVLAAMITQGIGTALLAVYTIVVHGYLPWTYLLLPVLWTAELLTMLGVAYFLAAVGAYFRDTKDFLQVFCLGCMYAMPIFYLPDWVPKALKPVLYANPFTYLAWCFQDAVYFGRITHPKAWPMAMFLAVVSCALGYRLFRKLRPFFASVL